MSRQLKFRAWDTVNKKWAFEGFHMLGEVMLFDLLSQYELLEHNNLEIQQFTGLHDRDGTQIYVGDVIAVANDGSAEPCLVVFDNGMFKIEGGKSLYETICDGQRVSQHFVIIGHRFEDPDFWEIAS